MKYRFIEAHRPMAPVRVFCRALGVTKAGFMAWRKLLESPRRSLNRQMAERIRRIHQDSGSTYGSPRIHQELRAQGLRVGRKRAARLMRELGITADLPKRFVVSTDSDHDQSVAANLLDRDFTTMAPD